MKRIRRFVTLAFAALVGMAAGPLRAQEPAGPPARPLSLEAALQLAESRSEGVGIARADVTRAQGERRRVRSGYLPQLNGSASYQRTLQSQFSVFQQAEDTTTAPAEPARECARFTPNPSQSIDQRLGALEDAVECASASDPFAAFRNLPFGRENTWRFGLSASQALFTGGRLGGQSQAADASLRSAELSVTAARAQTLLDVAQAYYDAKLGDRLVAIAEATLRQADTTLAQTRLAKQVGDQSEFELLRARVTRDNQRPVVIQRSADRDLAYVRLRQLLDIPLDQPLALTTDLGDTTLLASPRIDELVDTPGDTTVDRRVVVRQAAEALTSQRGQLRVARAQRLPQLTLSSDFAELGYPGNGSPFGADYLTDWTVSVGLSLPLFTGGRIRGEVETARASVTQAELRLKQTRERAQLDTRNASLQLGAAVAAWEASAGTEEQAARAYEIADLRYREGLSTQTELNDVRIQLAQAQSTRARAARDLQLARARMALLPALPLTTVSGAAPAEPAAAAPAMPTPSVPPPSTTTTTTSAATGVPPGTAFR